MNNLIDLVSNPKDKKKPAKVSYNPLSSNSYLLPEDYTLPDKYEEKKETNTEMRLRESYGINRRLALRESMSELFYKRPPLNSLNDIKRKLYLSCILREQQSYVNQGSNDSDIDTFIVN